MKQAQQRLAIGSKNGWFKANSTSRHQYDNFKPRIIPQMVFDTWPEMYVIGFTSSGARLHHITEISENILHQTRPFRIMHTIPSKSAGEQKNFIQELETKVSQFPLDKFSPPPFMLTKISLSKPISLSLWTGTTMMFPDFKPLPKRFRWPRKHLEIDKYRCIENNPLNLIQIKHFSYWHESFPPISINLDFRYTINYPIQEAFRD